MGEVTNRNHEPHEPHERVRFASEVYRVQGAIFEVNRQMGCGFLEAVYQECLKREFELQRIPFLAKPRLALSYKGQALSQTYSPDFLCYGEIVIEIKAARDLAPEHRAQLHNYLVAGGFSLGLLVNFGRAPKARIERIVI